jgi:hypothetical protein
MYNNTQFEADFIRAYGYLGPANFRFGTLAKNAAGYIAMCFRVYKNSAQNSLGSLVVGRIVKKMEGSSQPINLQQIGYGLDDIERANFGSTNATDIGSVLNVNNGHWSTALNDSWLMGGIHAGVDFYVASPRTAQNIIDPQFGATVTGRELFGLTLFGYSIHANTSLGEVYVCTDATKARNATFTAYEKAFNTAKTTRDGFKHLVNT